MAKKVYKKNPTPNSMTKTSIGQKAIKKIIKKPQNSRYYLPHIANLSMSILNACTAKQVGIK